CLLHLAKQQYDHEQRYGNGEAIGTRRFGHDGAPPRGKMTRRRFAGLTRQKFRSATARTGERAIVEELVLPDA
ncbi:hypothetical protein, partial [Pseudomonas aeruginosa]|uniref:hypothetical protein n=1 Tax=Pseudomonas aeruginosa TaxID=287 RepID=UPI001C65868C